MKKNLTFKELIFVASMLFGMFFGAGNLIFPIFMGQLAGHHVVGGIGRFSDHRCRASASWCGGALASARKTGLLELSSQIGRKLRSFLYVSFVFDDRAFFCNPKMRYGFVYSWNRAVYFRRREDGRIGNILFCIFCRCIVFFIEAGTDLNVDRENTESSVFNFVEYFCYFGRFFSPAGNMSKIEASGAYVSGAFSTGLLEGIIRWMLWPGLLSELLLLM